MTLEGSGACPACRARLHGRYCHDCGQDTRARPRPLRQWTVEAFSEANLVDGRTARTLVALATAPGRLLEAYRNGAGDRYQTPTKLFIVATALFLLTLNFANVQIYQYVARVVDPARPVVASADPDGVTVQLQNAVQGELWMQRKVEPTIDPAVTAAISAAAERAVTNADRQNLLYENQANREQATITARLAGWLPNVLWLLMPMYALLLAPFFGRRRLLVEHLVFAMWAHVMAFSLLILLALAKGGRGGPGLAARNPLPRLFHHRRQSLLRGQPRSGAVARDSAPRPLRRLRPLSGGVGRGHLGHGCRGVRRLHQRLTFRFARGRGGCLSRLRRVKTRCSRRFLHG